MPDVALRLGKDMLVVAPLLTWGLLDPDTETRDGVDERDCLAYMNILDEDLIRDTYQRYRMAGASCVLTNTLAANRIALEAHGLEAALSDINCAGVRLAREAGFEHTFAVLAPASGEVLCEQLAVLLTEEPDALMVAGAHSTPVEELKAALARVRAQTSLPLIAACSVEKLVPSNGAAVSSYGKELAELADILCVQSLDSLGSLRTSLEYLRGVSEPLMVCLTPPASEGSTTPQRERAQRQAASAVYELACEARAGGVQFVGTAPGALPVFTGAAYGAVGGLDVVLRAGATQRTPQAESGGTSCRR